MYSFFHLVLAGMVGYSWGSVILGVADLLALLSIPSVLLRRRGRPLAAMSWLLALFVLPYLGVLGWWIIGREHVRRNRRLRRRSTEAFREDLRDVEQPSGESALHEAFEEWVPRGLFDEYGPLQVMGPSIGNQTDLLVDGPETFPVIEQMIERADEYLHLLFYIWQDDETGGRLVDRLVDKVRQGVEVRVLVDGFGSPKFDKGLAKPLVEAGGKVGTFLPPRYLTRRPTFNFRNHRKLVVADGSEALIGGMNVGDEYARQWHDLALHLQGPVVHDLHAMFLDDWLFATGENLATERYLGETDLGGRSARPLDDSETACAVFASGPDSEQPALLDGLVHAINGARDRLWMMTPYFIPNSEMLSAFRAAVQRGVDVRLVLPERGDVPIVRRASRAYYPTLLNSGVRLFEYQPRVLHAKAVLVDRRFTILGSANLDVRSFEIDFELTTFLASRALNADLAEVFETDFEQCREVDRQHVEDQWWVSTLGDSLAHLTSPQL